MGRAQRTFRTSRWWTEPADGITLRPSATVRCRYYLRLLVADQPGVLAEIAHILAV